MATDPETIREGIGLAKEGMGLIREILGMAGMGTAGTTIPSGTDTTVLLLRIANTLDKIEENTRK